MTDGPEADSREQQTVTVQDCSIAFRRLGPVDEGAGARPCLLLIHGGAAHSGWWSRVAPILAQRQPVTLLDLSGHGESGHRTGYSPQLWADEVAAVLRATTMEPAVVVGHSMGGLIGVATAARWPELVRGLVLIDTRLPLRGLPAPSPTPKIFASAEQALGRFRLMPERTTADPGLLAEIANAGLCETENGWRWKFDPAARRRLTNDGVRADLAALICPVGYAYGAGSDVGGPSSLQVLETALGQTVPCAVVPGSFHHVPLDQPLACADAIEALLPH